jgi:hypothetical protein
MGWFEETRINRMSQTLSSSNSGLANWGRGQFANNFAQGGITSYMFSPGGQRPWGKTERGSTSYMRRLEAMSRATPQYADKINQSKNFKQKYGPPKGNILGAAGSIAAIGFIAAPAFTTKGSAADRMTGVAAGVGIIHGWGVGSEIGKAIGTRAGAAIGSIVGPIGTAIGAGLGRLVGYFGGGFLGSYIGEEGVHKTRGILDDVAAIGKRRRSWQGWYGDTAAFDTQKAVTMRQTSLQLMNQGMMSARSGLGHEGIMIHR